MILRIPTLLLLLLAFAATATAGVEADWRAPIYPRPERTVMLGSRGVQPNGAEDVAPRINAVLATLRAGETLYLDRGTYRVGEPLLMPSGVALQGPQDKAGRPLAELVQTRSYGTWGSLILSVVMNQNYRADEIIDRNIRVTALRIRHTTTGVMLRKVEGVVIEGCAISGGQGATAILGGRHSLVTHTLATATRNAAFDHWNGNEDATVTDSVAVLQGGHGILFNAVDTRLEPRTARTFTATRNVIHGVGADAVGIWVSPLGRGGGRIEGTITITDNTIAEPQPGARTAGIVVNASDATLVTLLRNSVTGVVGYPAIGIGPNLPREGNTGQLPARVVVRDNVVTDNKVSRSSAGVLRLWGRTVVADGNRLSGNEFVEGGAPHDAAICAQRSPVTQPVSAACAPQ